MLFSAFCFHLEDVHVEINDLSCASSVLGHAARHSRRLAECQARNPKPESQKLASSFRFRVLIGKQAGELQWEEAGRGGPGPKPTALGFGFPGCGF